MTDALGNGVAEDGTARTRAEATGAGDEPVGGATDPSDAVVSGFLGESVAEVEGGLRNHATAMTTAMMPTAATNAIARAAEDTFPERGVTSLFA